MKLSVIKKKLSKFPAHKIAEIAKLTKHQVDAVKYGRSADLDNIEKCLSACNILTLENKEKMQKLKKISAL